MGADGACLYMLQALLYLQQQFEWSSTHLDGHDVCVRPVQSNAITKWSEYGPVRGGVLVHKYIHLAGSKPMLARAVLHTRQHFLQQLQCGIRLWCSVPECDAGGVWPRPIFTVRVVSMQQLQCGIRVQWCCVSECNANSMWSGSVLTVGVVGMQQL